MRSAPNSSSKCCHNLLLADIWKNSERNNARSFYNTSARSTDRTPVFIGTLLIKGGADLSGKGTGLSTIRPIPTAPSTMKQPENVSMETSEYFE